MHLKRAPHVPTTLLEALRLSSQQILRTLLVISISALTQTVAVTACLPGSTLTLMQRKHLFIESLGLQEAQRC